MLQSFEVMGRTRTGTYSVTVHAYSAREALAQAKPQIQRLKPLSPVLDYRVVQYDPETYRQIDVTP